MESIDEVMTRYMRYVYAIVSAILGAGHDRDAEEVAADTFVAYWRTERYECSDAGTRALLGTIARHLALNRRAHIKRRYGISLPLPEDAELTVTEEDAYRTARLLARTEGIMTGITSGAALWAADVLARRSENEEKTIVALLPDDGGRYLSTPMWTEE